MSWLAAVVAQSFGLLAVVCQVAHFTTLVTGSRENSSHLLSQHSGESAPVQQFGENLSGYPAEDLE